MLYDGWCEWEYRFTCVVYNRGNKQLGVGAYGYRGITMGEEVHDGVLNGSV
jgi:hypothetical protein